MEFVASNTLDRLAGSADFSDPAARCELQINYWGGELASEVENIFLCVLGLFSPSRRLALIGRPKGTSAALRWKKGPQRTFWGELSPKFLYRKREYSDL